MIVRNRLVGNRYPHKHEPIQIKFYRNTLTPMGRFLENLWHPRFNAVKISGKRVLTYIFSIGSNSAIHMQCYKGCSSSLRAWSTSHWLDKHGSIASDIRLTDFYTTYRFRAVRVHTPEKFSFHDRSGINFVTESRRRHDIGEYQNSCCANDPHVSGMFPVEFSQNKRPHK